MKKCVLLLSFAGLLCLMTPATAHAGAPQYRQTRTEDRTALRKAPRPRHDQVHRGNLDGSLTLIQLISTRRSHDERHRDQAAPQDSVAQVRASWDDAERENPATLIARSVESRPPHWGATHLCI